MKKIFFFLFAILMTMHVSAQKQKGVEVLRYVEQMPQPGYSLAKYFSENFRYPDSARAHNIEGRVLVQFIIQETGEIDSIRIVGTKVFGYGLEEEAIRMVKLMPRWKPGKQNGTPVKVYFTQPITFKLEDNDTPPEIVELKQK